MLILTPKPHPTECISGYLHRLSSVNGYASPSWIIEPYRNGYHNDDYRRITPHSIQQIAGITEEEAQRVCVRPDRTGDRTSLRLVGTELHVSHVDMQSFRICPCCVGEHGRHEAFWHLRLVEWCPVHQVRLLTVCWVCRNELRWNRPGVGRCNCGADLTVQVSSERCDDRLSGLLLVIRRALYGSEHIDEAIPSDMAHLLHMDLYRLMRTIEVLSGRMFWREGGKAGITWRISAAEERGVKAKLLDIARALAPWPTGFREHLHARYDKVLSEDSSRRSFRDSFSWALWPLGKNLKEHAGQLAFLRDEVLRFGASYWTRDQLMRGAKIRDFGQWEFCWGSVPDAAEILGLDPRTLLKRIREGLVPVKEVATHRRNRNYKVDLQWARAQRYSAHPGVKIRSAATVLGLSPPMLSMLQANRAYRPTLMTRPPNTFAVEDIQRFKLELSHLVTRHSGDESLGGMLINGRRFDKIRSTKERASVLHDLIRH